MATFLTTPKMSPALRARVEHSVRGGKTASARLRPRSIMLLRVVALSSIAAALILALWSKKSADHETEQLRSGLLGSWHKASAGLSERDRSLHLRAAPWLLKAGKRYPGDFIAEDIDGADKLSQVLEAPIVYARGSLEQFSNSARLENSVRESVKDSFVLCLKDPPAARSEKAVLRRVRSAYTGGARMREHTANVQRLADAWVAAPVLSAGFAERLRTADTKVALLSLKRTLERAPTEGARRAAKAKLLLYLVDEPGAPNAVTELDGERPHQVRVGLIDLESNKPILQLRRPVDPSWLSDDARVEYARGADSCALALDVREAVSKS